MLCGGVLGPVKPSDEDNERFLPVLKTYLKEQIGHEPSDVKITDVSRQVVNGTNHFFRVRRNLSP